MSALRYRERPAAGEAAGLLVLHHGRGADEHDLLPLGEALDPGHRLHVVTPRAPLTVAGWPGNHWYLVPRVGHPDPVEHVDDQLLVDFLLAGRLCWTSITAYEGTAPARPARH